MKTKKSEYCRACGGNKGHNSARCTNAEGLRKIIRIQDGQLTVQDELRRQNKELSANVQELAAKVKWCETNSALVHRVVVALLDANEVLKNPHK